MRRLQSSRAGAVLVASAGPLGIVVVVLVVLRHTVFAGMVPASDRDVLGLWLPNHCFLGRSLAGGTIPAWTPYLNGGAPFAADPQSGWMYLPPMLLYSLLPCSSALVAFIVLQPILGGLGLYWFMRSEGAARASATVAGLVLAVALGATKIVSSLPFAAAVAWSAVLLAAASRYFRAVDWPRRIMWGIAVALAWGQLAAAHLSHGLVTGTLALLVYAVVRAVQALREHSVRPRELAGLAGLLVLALPALNLAFLLPRLMYVPETTLGLGYDGIRHVWKDLFGIDRRLGIGSTTEGSWLLRLAALPIAAALPVALAGLWSRRHRALTAAFAGLGVVCFAAGLGAVASRLAPTVASLPFGDFYLHKPTRLRYIVLLCVAVMVGLGVEALRTATPGLRRAAMLASGLAAFTLLPLAFGIRPSHPLLVVVSAAVIAACAMASARYPAAFVGVPVVVALALSLSALSDQAAQAAGPVVSRYGPGAPKVGRDFNAAAYLRKGPIVSALDPASTRRLLSLDPEISSPADSAALTARRLQVDRRAHLFRIPEVQGYNPVQLARYFSFVQDVNGEPLRYNTAVFLRPFRAVRDLLAVRWIVAPSGGAHPAGATSLATEDGWALYRLRHPSPMASLVGRVHRAGSPRAALAVVAERPFDSRSVGVLEEPVPRALRASGRVRGSVTYRPRGTQAARISVSASRAALLVVRTPYEHNWHAAIDGRGVPLLRADYLLQGVVVPRGRHVVTLTYDDPAIGLGLLGSGAAVVVMLGAAAGLRLLRPRGRPRDQQATSGISSGSSSGEA